MNRESAEKAAKDLYAGGFFGEVPKGLDELLEAVADIIERACGQDAMQVALRKLSQAMGNPAVGWNGETSSIEIALVEFAAKHIEEIQRERSCGETAWVSVEERLPEMDGTPYLANYVRYKPNPGEPLTEIDVWTAQGQGAWYNFKKFGGQSGITHWQPLPSPPTAEEKNER